MTTNEKFKFVLSNGEELFTTAYQARCYAKEGGFKIIEDGEFIDKIQTLKFCTKHRESRYKKDGFKPGFQPQLGIEVNSRAEYDKELKKRGLVEMGNEKPEHQELKRKSAFNDDLIKEIKHMGSNISDREIDALKTGEKLHKE